MASFIEDYICGIKECLDEIRSADINEVAGIVLDACQKRHRIFIMGNGGSAATASHFACDLAKGTVIKGGAHLPVISLTDNVPIMTAISNDMSYASVFKEQLMSLLSEGDVVIGISASGNSPNVLEAVEYAKSQGAQAIGLCAFGGGKLAELADKALTVSTRSYEQAEDIHMILAHLISQAVHQRMRGLD